MVFLALVHVSAVIGGIFQPALGEIVRNDAVDEARGGYTAAALISDDRYELYWLDPVSVSLSTLDCVIQAETSDGETSPSLSIDVLFPREALGGDDQIPPEAFSAVFFSTGSHDPRRRQPARRDGRSTDALQFYQTGLSRHKAGRLIEAERCYRSALRLAPGHIDSLHMLGVAYVHLDRQDLAVDFFRRVIGLQPACPMANHNLGNALMVLGDSQAAADAFQREIALRPAFAPAYAHLSIATLHMGKFDIARTAIRAAIALDPDNTWYRFLGSDLGEHDIVALEAMSPESGQARSEWRFALARAHHAAGHDAQAFANWLEGNAEKRRLIAYNEETALGGMAEMRELFTRAFLDERHGVGHPSNQPVFIVGMPRSGTSLIEQILSSHRDVMGGGELTHAPALIDALSAKLDVPLGFRPLLEKMSGADFRELGESYLARNNGTASRTTDKLPANFMLLGFLHLALPNATIIHAVRDPVDTCLSCFTTMFGTANFHTYDLAELGRCYRGYQDLMAHWHRVLPGRILDVRYEDVVADLEGQARRIVAHCGLAWDPSCLEFHKTARPVRTASATQVRQPIYDQSVGRWRRYEAFLGPLLTELHRT